MSKKGDADTQRKKGRRNKRNPEFLVLVRDIQLAHNQQEGDPSSATPESNPDGGGTGSGLPFHIPLRWGDKKENFTFLGNVGTKESLDIAQLNLRHMTGENLQACDVIEAALLLALEDFKEKGTDSKLYQTVLNLRNRKKKA